MMVYKEIYARAVHARLTTRRPTSLTYRIVRDVEDEKVEKTKATWYTKAKNWTTIKNRGLHIVVSGSQGHHHCTMDIFYILMYEI